MESKNGILVANALRIGNIVFDSKENKNISIAGEHLANLPAHFLPIPITYEWFKAFGFEPDGKFLVMLGYCILKSQGQYFISIKMVNGVAAIIRDIKYVHQLQNFFFACNDEDFVLA